MKSICIAATVAWTISASAALAPAEMERGVTFLQSSQRPDGSWAAPCAEEVEATAVAARALAEAGGPGSAAAVARAIGFLDALPEPLLNHHRALRALVKQAAGLDAKTDLDMLIAGLRTGYDPPGGWGLSTGSPSETIATALALEAISASPADAGREELVYPLWTLVRAASRLPVLFTADPASREENGNLYASAFGIVACHVYRVRSAVVHYRTWAIEAARARQEVSGGYGELAGSPSFLETAVLLHAIKSSHVLLTDHETRAAEYLRARQSADGSWDGDPLATAWAVRALAIPLDTDGDGMADAWESENGLDLNDPADSRSDADLDGLVAAVEFQRGTDPQNADTDGDGLSDLAEMESGSDPRDPTSANRPPSFASTPVTFAALGAPYRYAARALDADGDGITYILVRGPAGMGIDASSGVMTWLVPAGGAGSFPVALAARDGRGGQTTQSFVLEARAQGIDLVPTLVDLRGFAVDAQSLIALGTVGVDVENAGTGPFQGDFEITLFADANDTGSFETASDPVAGRGGFSGSIAAGAVAKVIVRASAAETFRDAPLFAFVDSGRAVGELDETNNTLSSASSSQFAGDLSKMRPVIEWWWKETDPPDFNYRVALPPVVANLTDDNRDGKIDERDVPEVLFVSASHQGFDGVLRAVSGDSGRLIWSWPNDGSAIAQSGVMKMVAVGDLEGDGAPEVVLTASLPSLSMVCINADGSEKWRQSQLPLYFNAGSFVLADLGGDGTLEILSGSNVFNHRGEHLWEAPYPTYGGPNTGLLSLPLAVDLDLDGKLEVVLGMSAHDLAGRQLWDWQTEGREESGFVSTFRRNGQPVRSFQASPPDFLGDAHTAAIQADDDLEPEILCVGWYGSEFAPRHVPVWILEPDGEVKVGPIELEFAAPERHRSMGSTSPLVADLDRDGRQDFIVTVESSGSQLVSPKQAGITALFALDRDGRSLWTAEFSSAGADYLPSGLVACDLDGDGQLEIVLQTVHQLHILEGRTGKSLWSLHADAFFRITTLPAVADVDNDGNAEIVGIATDQYTFGTPLNRGVFVIGDAADQWGNARRSWSQHRHLPSAIREDGHSIPNDAWNQTAVGAERIQTAIEGHGPHDAPDLTVSKLRNDPAACPSVVLLARVGNAGSLHVPAGVPVEFWRGDPDAVGTRIGVAKTTRTLEPGEHEEVRLAWPSAPAGGADVHAWVSPQRPWMRVQTDDLISEIDSRAPLATTNGSSQNTHGWGIFTYSGIDGSGWNDFGWDGDWLPYHFYEIGFAIPVTIESVSLKNQAFAVQGWRSADFLLWREGDAVPAFQTPVSLGAASVTVTVPDVSGTRRLRFQGNDVLNFASLDRIEVSGSFEDPYPDWDAGIYTRLNEGRGDNNRTAAALIWSCAGNAAPEITTAPPLLARPGAPYRYAIAAEDPNGEEVRFELIEGPAGMALSSPFGPVEWTPTPAQIGEHGVRVKARDSSGAEAEQIWTVAAIDGIAGENRAPRITSAAPSVATGNVWRHAFAASDPDGDPLLWILLAGPPGMELDAASGELAWPPLEGVFPVAVRVEDGRGGSDEQRFTLSSGESDVPLAVEPVDRDGDGHFLPADCNDANAAVNPAAAEIPGNGIDDDCNAATPDGIDAAAIALLVRPDRSSYEIGGTISILARATHRGGAGSISGLLFDLKIVELGGETLYGATAEAGPLLPGGRIERTFLASSSGWPAGTFVVRLDATYGAAETTSEARFELRAPPGVFRRGNAAEDGRVDLTDSVRVLGFLFLGDPRIACPDAADATDDGTIDITDPIYTLNYLFLAGEPPPAPGTEVCGPDPTADDLGPCEGQEESCGL